MLGRLLKSLLPRKYPAVSSSPPAGSSPDELAELGWIRHGAGDAEGARRLALQALSLSSNIPSAHELLANLALPGLPYLHLLKKIHELLRPATYVEIGIYEGESLCLAGAHTDAIGIDPAPALRFPLSARTRVFAQTSDAFFATHDLAHELGGRAVELAFIDGMHQFEFVLRDFIHLEKACSPASRILIHDCYPLDERTASPERLTGFWSGDVWRAVLALRKYRPDLELVTIAAPPTGLGLVRGLDPASRVLEARFDEIVRDAARLEYSVLEARKPEMLNLVGGDWDSVRQLLR